MKTFRWMLSLVLLCWCLSSYANSAIDSTAVPRDSLLGALDLSQVPSGLLAEAAFPMLDLDLYSGQIVNDTNRLVLDVYGMLYGQLSGAVVDTNELLPPPAYMGARDTVNSSTIIPIGIIAYQYQRVKDYALDSNLVIHTAGQLLDVTGRTELPYQADTVFAACSFINRVNSTNLQFQLDPHSWISNWGTMPDSIGIDFGDGIGENSYTLGQTISVTFDSTGLHTILVKAYYGAQVFASHFVIYITEADTALKYSGSPNIDSLVISASNVIGTGANSAFVSAFTHCQDTFIRKPLIYVEGFDPPEFSSLNFTRVREQLNFLLFSVTGIDSMRNGLSYMDIEGYDLIYINFNQNTDYIQNNAQVVQAVIAYVQDKLVESGSEEEIVIFAESMGGVISKYALLEMENNNEEHGVRLLMTFDSPHHGANVPLAAQAAYLQIYEISYGFLASSLQQLIPTPIGEYVPFVRSGFDVLSSPAARQMLYTHISEYFPITANDFPIPSSLHNDFYQELSQMGDLQQARFVGLSNGSIDGNTQVFGPGTTLIEIDENNLGIIPVITNLILSSPSASMSDSIIASILTAGLIISPTRIDLEIKSLPSYSPNEEQIFSGRYLASILGIPVLLNQKKLKVAEATPYDHIPGGIYNISSNIPGVLDSFSGIQIHHPYFCFVPTTSALDLNPPEDTNYLGDFSAVDSVISSAKTALDYYTGQLDSTSIRVPSGVVFMDNSEHVDFRPRLAQLFLYELLTGYDYPISNEITDVFNHGETDASTGFDSGFFFQKTRYIIDEDLEVKANGALWINRSGDLAFQSVGNPVNRTPATYQLFIKASTCNQATTTLTCSNGGQMLVGEAAVGNTAEVFIQDQATLIVQKNSRLLVDSASTVYVQSGGTLQIAQNGTLEVLGNGQIVVEAGGILRIGSGTIDLEALASNILIQSGGELRIDDAFSFPGNGFLQFDAGNVLNVQTAGFSLEGPVAYQRFIRLNSGAELQIGSGKNLTLKKGLVEFASFSMISVAQGAVDLDFVEFAGETTFTGAGLQVTDGTNLSVTACRFIDLAQCLALDGYTGTAFVNLDYCTFNDFQYKGLIIDGCSEDIFIKNSSFTTTSAFTAIELADTRYTRLYNTSIESEDHADDAIGLRLKTARITVLDQCDILACDIGIDGRQQTGPGEIYYNNVDLINQTTIQDCNVGIFLEGAAGISDIDRNHGRLYMDCAHLIQNDEHAIQGTDILLTIDALNNSNCDDINCTDLRPNTFERANVSDDWFDICYEDFSEIDEVFARGNFWGNAQNPTSSYYIISPPTNCGVVSANLPLNYVPAYVPGSEGLVCAASVGDPGSFPTDDKMQTCGMDANIGDSTKIDEHLFKGFYYLKQDSLSEAIQEFTYVATVDDANIPTDSTQQICQQKVAVARTFVAPSSGQSSTPVIGEWGQDNRFYQQNQLTIAPNPSGGYFTVRWQTEQQPDYLEVFNHLGQSMFQRYLQTSDEMVELNLEALEEGMYFIHLVGTDSRILAQERVIIQ